MSAPTASTRSARCCRASNEKPIPPVQRLLLDGRGKVGRPQTFLEQTRRPKQALLLCDTYLLRS
jgi:hypothetical protein